MQRTNSNSQQFVLAAIDTSPPLQRRRREATPTPSSNRHASPPRTPPSKLIGFPTLSKEKSFGAMSIASSSSDDGGDSVPTDADWTSEQDGLLLEAYDDVTNPCHYTENNNDVNPQEEPGTGARMLSPPPPPLRGLGVVPPQQTRQRISKAAIRKYLRQQQRSNNKVREWTHSLKATRSRVGYLAVKHFGGPSSSPRRPSLSRSLERSTPEPDREREESGQKGPHGGPVRKTNRYHGTNPTHPYRYRYSLSSSNPPRAALFPENTSGNSVSGDVISYSRSYRPAQSLQVPSTPTMFNDASVPELRRSPRIREKQDSKRAAPSSPSPISPMVSGPIIEAPVPPARRGAHEDDDQVVPGGGIGVGASAGRRSVGTSGGRGLTVRGMRV